MKRLFLLLLLTALGAGGCTKSSPALGQFVGTWNATYSLFDSSGVRVTSGKLTVKQPSADTVTFAESTSVVTGAGQFGVRTETRSFDVRLKEAGGGNYALDLKIDGKDVVTNFPMTYSDSDGFNGRGSVTLDGSQHPVTASIKKDGQGFVWKISADGNPRPKAEYEFTLKEKS